MSTEPQLEVIYPDWPAPGAVRALSTTRPGGVSQGCYASLNLAMHVEDEAGAVSRNRQRLCQQLALPSEPVWLEQVHGRDVFDASLTVSSPPQADASFSHQENRVCVVMTADCLPLLICNRKGDRVAAAHAGWRGLAGGVIEATVKTLQQPADQLMVWLGPAIGPTAFEVGEEVRQAFIQDLQASEGAFRSTRPGHYLADIYQLARLRLSRIGIEAVYGGEYCTWTDADHFYSYRRDGKTGRQASMIWIQA